MVSTVEVHLLVHLCILKRKMGFPITFTPRISPHSSARNKLGKNDGRYDISSAFFGRWNLELGWEKEGEKKEGRTGVVR